jgi:hypothetical protein
VELIAIALVIVLSVGLAAAATKLVMDVLLLAMRAPHRISGGGTSGLVAGDD